MSDRSETVPIDPLRSGGIFRLNRAGLPAAIRTPVPSTLAVPSSESAGLREATAGAGGDSAPFNAAYSARVRARFNELYRATPIPVSILYDTPAGRTGAAAVSSIGSADSNATTVAQSPALQFSNKQDGGGSSVNSSQGCMQIPLKTIGGGPQGLFSPQGSAVRRPHRPRDSGGDGSGGKGRSGHIQEDVDDATPAPYGHEGAQISPFTPGSQGSAQRTVKRLRPELVSPLPSEPSIVAQIAAASVPTAQPRSTGRSLLPSSDAAVYERVAPEAKPPDLPTSVARVATAAAEEEDIGDEDSYGPGSEDDIDDLDGMGEFLERALADADSEEDDVPAEEPALEASTHAPSEPDGAPAAPSPPPEQEPAKQEIVPEMSESPAKVESPVKATAPPVVEYRSPIVDPSPKDPPSKGAPAPVRQAPPAAPRGRGATQVNSFLSNLPPPPAPTSKSILSGSKSTPPPAPATKPPREVHSAPPARSVVKAKSVEKKRKAEPVVGGGLRLVQLRDLGSSSSSEEEDFRLSTMVRKRKIATKASKITTEPSMQQAPKSEAVELKPESSPRQKKEVIKTVVVEDKPSSEILKPDVTETQALDKKEAETEGVKSTKPSTTAALPESSAPAILLGSDMTVWSTEEFAALKNAYYITSLTEPDFWSIVADLVNAWREEVHRNYLAALAQTKAPKRKGGRGHKKSKNEEELNAVSVPSLVLRTADECQQRWFKSMDQKVVAAKRGRKGKPSSDEADAEDVNKSAAEKPTKRLTKAKIREIVAKAAIGRPDDIFDAIDQSNGATQYDSTQRGRQPGARTNAAVNYYKKRDREISADVSSAPHSDEKRRRSQSETPASTPKRVLRSEGRSTRGTDKSSAKKTVKTKIKAMIYTPQDLEAERTPGRSTTPQLADRISTRSGVKKRSSSEDPDVGLDAVKRYLYERPTARGATKNSDSENKLSNGSKWTASYASNLSKRKVPVVSAAAPKPGQKKTKALSAEGSFHNKADAAVIDALRDGQSVKGRRGSKSPGWKPAPSGRVRARIDPLTGRVITSVDAGSDSNDESDADDEDLIYYNK